MERIRKIRKDGSPELQEAVKSDKLSINRAFRLICRVEPGKNKSKLSPAQMKTLKFVLGSDNFVGLIASGGNLGSHLDKAVEWYMRNRDEENSSTKHG